MLDPAVSILAEVAEEDRDLPVRVSARDADPRLVRAGSLVRFWRVGLC